MRRLEEARTEEREAAELRETRRERREAGLPELTPERAPADGPSRPGSRSPLTLVAAFLVVVVVVGGVAYPRQRRVQRRRRQERQAGGGEGCSRPKSKSASSTAPRSPASPRPYGDKVEGKGFNLGAVTNSSASFAESVVMFSRGHKTEARTVAKQLGISKLQLMSGEIESVSAGGRRRRDRRRGQCRSGGMTARGSSPRARSSSPSSSSPR